MSFGQSTSLDYCERVYMTEEVLMAVIEMVEKNAKPYAPVDGSHLTNMYADQTEIGRGAYGTVYRVGNREVAVKVMSPWEDNAKYVTNSPARKVCFLGLCQQSLQEAVLQSDVLDHPNVVKVHDKWMQYEKSDSGLTPEQMVEIIKCKSEPKPELLTALDATKDLKFCLCMDLYKGDLKTWLQDRDEPKDDVTVAKLSKDIIDGLAYVHGKGYTHGDILIENILFKRTLNGSITAALADFGKASKIPEENLNSNESLKEEIEFLAKVVTQLKNRKVIPEEEWWKHTSLFYTGFPMIYDNNLPRFYVDFIIFHCLRTKPKRNSDLASYLSGVTGNLLWIFSCEYNINKYRSLSTMMIREQQPRR